MEYDGAARAAAEKRQSAYASRLSRAKASNESRAAQHAGVNGGSSASGATEEEQLAWAMRESRGVQQEQQQFDQAVSLSQYTAKREASARRKKRLLTGQTSMGKLFKRSMGSGSFFGGSDDTWYPSAAPEVNFWNAFTENKKKELSKAKNAAALKQIVKIQIDQDPDSHTPFVRNGKKIKVTHFKFRDKRSTLADYGCSAAVNLYLQFQVECGVLFLLMFLIAIPDLLNNYSLNHERNDCRVRTQSAAAYEAVTAFGTPCGWAGEPIQHDLSRVPWYLQFARGTCQEYSNSSDGNLLPINAAPPGLPPIFLQTPDADYCQQRDEPRLVATLAYWLQFFNVFLFFAFLVRIRRMQRVYARNQDRAVWTAADYSVQIRGLEKNAWADNHPATASAPAQVGLEERVYRDLERLGFERRSIVQVEIGRMCSEDVKMLAALKELRIRLQELRAKEKDRKERGKEPALTEKMSRELAKVTEREREAKRRLQQLREEEPDTTTGHAFVVFLYESDRDRLVGLCRKGGPASLLPVWCCPSKHVRWESAGNQPVDVVSAPEPDDIRWENLEITDGWRACQKLKTLVVTLILLAIGGALIVGSRVLQSRIDVTSLISESDQLTPEELAWQVEIATLGVSAGASIVTVAVNMALKVVITRMTVSEGEDTQTDYETSLFAKLSLAYIFNSAFIPMAIGMVFSAAVSGRPVNQAWYAPGGVITQAMFLMLSSAIIPQLLKVVPIFTLLRRHILAPFVVSQQKLNELWEPPPMYLGDLYASNLKTVALCLLYAPLWPFAYLITFFALLFNFVCTKFAVAKWYKRPPMVGEDMMAKYRGRLGALMFLHTLVSAMGAEAASRPTSSEEVFDFGVSATAPIISMFAMWIIYTMIDVPDCLNLISYFRPFDELTNAKKGKAGDTGGIPYRNDEVGGHVIKGVEEAIGYPIDFYACPADKRRSVDELIAHAFRDFGEQVNHELHRSDLGSIELASFQQTNAGRYPSIDRAGGSTAYPPPTADVSGRPTLYPSPSSVAYPTAADVAGAGVAPTLTKPSASFYDTYHHHHGGDPPPTSSYPTPLAGTSPTSSSSYPNSSAYPNSSSATAYPAASSNAASSYPCAAAAAAGDAASVRPDGGGSTYYPQHDTPAATVAQAAAPSCYPQPSAGGVAVMPTAMPIARPAPAAGDSAYPIPVATPTAPAPPVNRTHSGRI